MIGGWQVLRVHIAGFFKDGDCDNGSHPWCSQEDLSLIGEFTSDGSIDEIDPIFVALVAD